jgi:hypothetical protein
VLVGQLQGEHDRLDQCIHHLFAAQARARPSRRLTFAGQT